MEDTDDHRHSASPKSIFEMGSSAFQSQHSFCRESTTAHDHESLIRAAMEEAAGHPERHRMAVRPSASKRNIAVINVKKLTTSNKQLVLSRAMETGGQDNAKLLTKIRDRQDTWLE